MEREMAGCEVAGREVAGRERLVAHWLDLTRNLLPGMAAAHRWPIRWDHCFMRVCLDNALRRPWHEVVRRPAIRHLDLAQLQAAIKVAEEIIADPALLPGLNRSSLEWRRASRAGGADP